MLGRTAANLFWMARYIERAENIARLAEVGFRITLTPDSSEGHREEWRSALTSAGALEEFERKHAQIHHKEAIDFLLFDLWNIRLRVLEALSLPCLISVDRQATGLRSQVCEATLQDVPSLASL